MRAAAASANLTIAVATATLIAVGAILAGPSIVDCSKSAAGIGACLRDRLDPADPVIPPPPPGAEGWIDATATEFGPPAVAPVELESSPAQLAIAEIPAVSPPTAEVAIAPPVELAIASPAPNSVAPSVALVGPEGELAAQGGPELPPVDTPPVSLPPSGDLTITATAEPPPSAPPPVTLFAEPTPLAPEPAPIAPEPEPEPTLVVEFNPAYPNVIVLPAPLTGDDSSFRALQLN